MTVKIRDFRTSLHPERDAAILALCRQGNTYRSVADVYGLSPTRIRQIDHRCSRIERMRWIEVDMPVEVLVRRQGMDIWVPSKVDRVYSWGIAAPDEMGRPAHFYEQQVRPMEHV